MVTDALDFPRVRGMEWSRARARVVGGDKEFDRLAPAAIHVEDGVVPRSHAVLESVLTTMRNVGQLVPLIVTGVFFWPA